MQARPPPEKLSSWTDDYDGEACEIKYYSVILTLTATNIGLSPDYYVSNVQITATTPDGDILSAGPTTLRQSTLDMSVTKLALRLDRIPEGSRVIMRYGSGTYRNPNNLNWYVADVRLVDPRTGNNATGIISSIQEQTTLWVKLIGNEDTGGGPGGLLLIV